MNYRPGSKIVCHPIFTNDRRSRIGAVVRDPASPLNVQWCEDDRESGSPFIRDVFDQWDEATVTANTERELAIVSANRKATMEMSQRAEQNAVRQALYERKAELVESLPTKELRRLARKAGTMDRLTAIEAAAVLVELEGAKEDADAE